MPYNSVAYFVSDSSKIWLVFFKISWTSLTETVYKFGLPETLQLLKSFENCNLKKQRLQTRIHWNLSLQNKGGNKI